METNYIYMTQINHNANRKIAEMEIEKEKRQMNRKLNNAQKIKAQERKCFCALFIVLALIGIGFFTGIVSNAKYNPNPSPITMEEEHYVPDKISVIGIVTEATETGCLIETFDELDGHVWYWEFDDTQYYVGEYVTLDIDRCYTTEIENYQILDVNY